MLLKIVIFISIIMVLIIYEYIKDKLSSGKKIVVAQNRNDIEVYRPQYGTIEPISHIERKTTITNTNTRTTTEIIYYYHEGGGYIEDIH